MLKKSVLPEVVSIQATSLHNFNNNTSSNQSAQVRRTKLWFRLSKETNPKLLIMHNRDMSMSLPTLQTSRASSIIPAIFISLTLRQTSTRSILTHPTGNYLYYLCIKSFYCSKVHCPTVAANNRFVHQNNPP